MRIEQIEWDGLDPAALARRVRALVPGLGEVGVAVSEAIAAVRERGDEAVRALGEGFGEEAPARLRVDPDAIAAAPALVSAEVRDAMRIAAANIAAVARAELAREERPTVCELESGQRIEVGSSPVAAAGIYAPGGRGAYPSSLLMCAVPARVAGVPRIAVASPPALGGRPHDAVLAACAIAGIDEVYAVGGAQAIAALAFGTETVARVDVIAGPGSRFVTEAKRAVSGWVGIDSLAGPSELLVVADGSAAADAVALDLCAQAEHGPDSLVAVISPDRALLDRVAEIAAEIAAEQASVSDAPLAVISSPGLELALSFADELAPEHLELGFAGADELTARPRVAGCVFVGAGGATAFGDYIAGSNHVLPTGGAARFGGPLGPGAFLRRSSVVSIPSRAAGELASHVEAIAECEGFPVHGESARARAGRER